MDEFLKPAFDSTQLSAVQLQQLGNVTIDELVYIYKNKRSRIYDTPGFPRNWMYHLCIGFSFKSRFLFIV